MPALFTRMSTEPNCAAQRCASSVPVDGSLTSPRVAATPPRAPDSFSTARAAASSSMSATSTLAPASVSRLAMPKPIPIAPPVTIALFPVRSNGPHPDASLMGPSSLGSRLGRKRSEVGEGDAVADRLEVDFHAETHADVVGRAADDVREDLEPLVDVDDRRRVRHPEARGLRPPHDGPAVDAADTRAALPLQLPGSAPTAQ